MKLLFSEYPPEYKNYYFPYHIWGMEESSSERDLLLNRGFLPTRFKIGLWYLARSSRIHMSNFAEASENRRIRKQTENFSFQVVPIQEFSKNTKTDEIIARYTKEIIDISLSPAAQKRIFSPHLSNFVFVWFSSESSEIIGFSPIMVTDHSVFYWYGFYLPEYHRTGLGIRMMLEAIAWTKSNGSQYTYVGTVYTSGSLYKTNFSGFEFFNGLQWRNNIDELKYLIDRDTQTTDDLLKDEQWRKKFYNSASLSRLFHQL
jgi:hypothetical protein